MGVCKRGGGWTGPKLKTGLSLFNKKKTNTTMLQVSPSWSFFIR